MSNQPRPGALLPIVATLIVLIGIYIATYYLTVDVGGWASRGESGNTALYPGMAPDGSRWLTPDGYLARIFKPIHRVDRMLRPHVWNEP